MITNCNFKLGSTPHLCISPKCKKYFKKILVNDDNIIMNEFFGQCFAADNALKSSDCLVHAEKSYWELAK
jgi:hypothetical protein